jgi:hypothetical protein
MKKKLLTKVNLRVVTEKVRELSEIELNNVAGAYSTYTTLQDNANCKYTTQVVGSNHNAKRLIAR